MKKTNFTYFNGWRMLVPVLMMFLSSMVWAGNPTSPTGSPNAVDLTCIGGSPTSPALSIGLDGTGNCSFQILTTDVLAPSSASLAGTVSMVAYAANAAVGAPPLASSGPGAPLVFSSTVALTLIDQVIKVKASLADGTSCWAYVKITDERAPTIVCPPRRVLSCAQVPPGATPSAILAGRFRLLSGTTAAPSLSPAFINPAGTGTISDCSRIATINFSDENYETSCTAPFGTGTGTTPVPAFNDAAIDADAAAILADAANAGRIIRFIVRTFTVTDWYGNSAQCKQLIAVRRANLGDIYRPLDLEFSCADAPTNLTPANLATLGGSVAANAYPGLDTDNNGIPDVTLSGTNSCNINASYRDDAPIEICAGSFKIIRHWTVLDWCAPAASNTVTYDQLIKVLDKTPPTVTARYTTYRRVNDGNWCATDIHGGTTNYTRWETSATNATTNFDGSVIQGLPDVLPSVTEIVALGNSGACTGTVTITFDAKDLECTRGIVSLMSSDSRFVQQGSGTVLNAATGERRYTFTGTFPFGSYPIRLTARDACGYALATKDFEITIVDNVKPNPVCVEYTQVALTNANNGTVIAYTESFNNGSNDNCMMDGVWVRRMTGAGDTSCSNGQLRMTPLNTDPCFYKFVTFTCDDVNDTVQVIMRVRDAAGNYNDCMVQVLVEDKVRPTCVAPANLTIACNEYDNLLNYSQYGQPTFFDNCRFTVDTVAPVVTLDNCKNGTIVRSWRVQDCNYGRPGGAAHRVTCSQTITVRSVSAFKADFPDDIVTNCFQNVPGREATRNAMLTNPATVDGHIVNFGCGVLAVEVTDDTLYAQPDACYKILRRITVIDWCKYNPNNNVVDRNVNAYGRPLCGDVHSNANWRTQNIPTWQNLFDNYGSLTCNIPQDDIYRERCFLDADQAYFDFLGLSAGPRNGPQNAPDPRSFSDGYISFIQTIKVLDNTAPTIVGCPAGLVTVDDYSATGCSGIYTETIGATDDCNGVPTPGGAALDYAWFIYNDAVSTLIPVATGVGNSIYTQVGVTRTPGYRFDYGITHRIVWMVRDKCGNMARCEHNGIVVDRKKPGIICQDVNAELMWVVNAANPTGAAMIEVWATDLLASPLSDNCTSRGFLDGKLRLTRDNVNTYSTSAGTSVMFNCATDPIGTRIPVRLWTQDSAGNSDFCVSYVTLQRNRISGSGSSCTGSILRAEVAGSVSTESRTNVPNVNVAATMTTTNQVMGSNATTTGGAFSITGLTPGANYRINAAKTNNTALEIRRLVTAADRAMLQGYIVGATDLNSAYKIISADVNRDGDVNTLDALQMQRFILGITQEMPNAGGSFWRFINRAHTFATPTSPLPLPASAEAVDISNLPTSAQANFTGLLVGDLNGSVDNALTGASLRSAKVLNLNVENVKLVAGRDYTVTLNADNVDFKTLQATFNFDQSAVELTGVNGALKGMNASNFAMFQNAITTAWDGQADRKDVINISFRAKKDANLSDILTIGSNIAYAEARDVQNEAMDVQLRFKGAKATVAGFELYQNTPNPTNGNTRIGFSLPEASDATLTVYDAAGRSVMVKKGAFTQGYNVINIEKSDLGATGVFYYRLDSNGNSATKKMIIIE
jgi:hypothetical protein